ncbi:MAG: Fic family protein [Candidatus Nomurabacteria bacterium]|jgi:Fic family protein|nr:Fic family protein [Candidatus Nomurabacteria bacterium]
MRFGIGGGRSHTLEEVIYTAPPPEHVEDLTVRLLDYLKLNFQSINPLILAAILHIEFVDIHPFTDGNGRLARLLTLLMLGLTNYDFRGTLVPENYYIADRSAYYEAIRSAQGKKYDLKQFPDLTTWIDYFIGGIAYSALEVLESVTLIETPLATRFTKKMSSDSIQILSYVKQFGSITIETATELLPDLNRRTVQRRLKKLVDDGQLKIVGETKNSHYIWQPEP